VRPRPALEWHQAPQRPAARSADRLGTSGLLPLRISVRRSARRLKRCIIWSRTVHATSPPLRTCSGAWRMPTSTCLFAPCRRYGTPDDLRRLVDSRHPHLVAGSTGRCDIGTTRAMRRHDRPAPSTTRRRARARARAGTRSPQEEVSRTIPLTGWRPPSIEGLTASMTTCSYDRPFGGPRAGVRVSCAPVGAYCAPDVSQARASSIAAWSK
jgi:hypothetical protein